MLFRILYSNRGDAMVQSALVQRFRMTFVLVPSALPMPSISAVNPVPEAAAQVTPARICGSEKVGL